MAASPTWGNADGVASHATRWAARTGHRAAGPDTGMETYFFSSLLVVACRGGSSGTTLNHYM